MSGCVHVAVCVGVSVCVCKTQRETERESKRMREQERHGGDISFQNAVYSEKNIPNRVTPWG